SRLGSAATCRISSVRLPPFNETVVTHQLIARALQPETGRIIGPDELRGSVALKLVASVHFGATRI
ncbi:MAG: hypothetical protein J2P21_20400, partial [Chloracidobacterium sp.]|nr:hypothetical protein [Chloracidobacterium sp.]